MADAHGLGDQIALEFAAAEPQQTGRDFAAGNVTGGDSQPE